MNSKLKAAETLFAFLNARPDFRIVSETESNDFDNACDVWAVSRLLVRFVCERGEVSVEVSSGLTDKWCDLGLLKVMIKGGNVKEKPSLHELANFVDANLEILVRLFLPDELINTEAKLTKLRQQRVQQMFPNIR